MPTRIRRRITSSRRDEIEKEQEEQSHQIIRPFENVHGLPVSYTASSQSSFLNQPLTVKDTGILYLSLIKSRSNYLKLCPMFQLYWVKQSSYIKKLVEQDKPIPEHLKRDDMYANRSCVLNNDISARDIMVKLLECGLSIGVHFFDIRVFIAKDERSDTKEEKERMKRERAEKKAQREQEKLERKARREQEMREREERKIQKEIEKREAILKKKEEQSQIKSEKSAGNNDEKIDKLESTKGLAKVSKVNSKKGKTDTHVKTELHSKEQSKDSPPPVASSHGDLQSPENQRMITNLNYIGSKNKDLNDLMNKVASGRATAHQIMLFQKYIREAKSLGPAPHSETVINELVEKINNEVLEEQRLDEGKNDQNSNSDQESRLNAHQDEGVAPHERGPSGDRASSVGESHGNSIEDRVKGDSLDPKEPHHENGNSSGTFVKSEKRDNLSQQIYDPKISAEEVGQPEKKKKVLKKDIPKDQKLTAFQEKYTTDATVLFEFIENPNVRFQFPKFAICEVIDPSTQINSENGDNSDNKDILVSFLWVHNQIALEKYERELSEYNAKIKEQEEKEKREEEEEEERKKAEAQQSEGTSEKPNEEISTVSDNIDAEADTNDQKVITVKDSSLKEASPDEQSTPTKRRAPPPRRGKKRRKGPLPKNVAPKPLSPPEEPTYSYSSVSFTIHGIANKFVPIFVNSMDPIEKVRAKMEHIIENGNRITPYQLWYQVDGKLDAELAETARVALNQKEKKMTGIPTIQEKVEPKKYPKKKKVKEADRPDDKQASPAHDSVVMKTELVEENTVPGVERGSDTQPPKAFESSSGNVNATKEHVKIQS